jgi:alpha-1,2-mannosyltransferase
VNLNPPISVLLFQLVAHVDPDVAFRGWQIGSALLYVAVVAWLLRTFPTPERWWLGVAMLVWSPFWSTLDLGQLYVPLLALAAIGFVFADRKPWLAGACIGLLVAIKPQYAIWPVLLVAAGHWRPSLAALLTGAAASLLPIALGHADWYAEWLAASGSLEMLVYTDNLSLPSLLTRAGVPLSTALAATAAWLVALAVTVAIRRWPTSRTSSVALVSAALAGPVSWVGYALLLAPVLISAGGRTERMTLAVLLLSVPGVLLWWSHAGSLIYDIALALCLWATLVERPLGASGRWRVDSEPRQIPLH